MLLYYFTIALQVFCLYHVYKNRNEYYWYFIIFFIPLVGCLVYLFINVFNKKDITRIKEEITIIVKPTKKTEDLKKELNFSNSFQNKINLADAYVELNDYKNAIYYYENALVGNFKNNPHTLNKLIYCYYHENNFKKVIEYSDKINLDRDFKMTNFFVGLALEKLNRVNEAENYLTKIDVRYSNYDERLELSNFFIRHNKKEDAKKVLDEIVSELNSIKSKTRKHKFIISEVEKILLRIKQKN